MKISVIIPVYKVEEFIAEALRSVFEQSAKDMEIILIDDCSPDRSMAIVQSILSEKPDSMTLQLLRHEQNSGLSAARNTGLKQASGDYIYFMDSDDLLPADSLEYLSNLALQWDADIVTGNFRRFSSDDELKRILLTSSESETAVRCFRGRKEVLLAFSKGEWPMSGCNKLIRRNILLEHNLFFIPGLLHEDGIWNFQTAFHFSLLVASSRCTYAYRFNPSSITACYRECNIESFGTIVVLYYRGLKSLPDEIQMQMCNWFEATVHNMTNHASLVLPRDKFRNWYSSCRQSRYPFLKWWNSPLNRKIRFWSFWRYLPNICGFAFYRLYALYLRKKLKSLTISFRR